MLNSLIPNFSTKNIVQDIQELTSLGLKGAELASKGVDWDSVVKPLDLISHEIGKSTSINSHINSVMYSDEFNKEYEKTLPINLICDRLRCCHRLKWTAEIQLSPCHWYRRGVLGS